jgi:methylenetetrahydrofolate dehydrogenase (NADP+)/methenyltetrahydrofolate cyclohydrolase
LRLDGRVLARQLEEPLRARVQALRALGAPVPRLAIVLVGPDALAVRQASLKVAACRRTGIAVALLHLPERAATRDVLAAVDSLNADPAVHGIFLQYPLPPQVDERRCGDGIAPAKDVDGAGSLALGLLATGAGSHASTPATARGILRLLTHHPLPIAGKRALVVGSHAAPAKALALMLLAADATVTLCDARAAALPSLVAGAELLVAAAGRPRLIAAAWIRHGAIVVDLGLHHVGGLVVGDVDLTAPAADRCLAYTPVPGGAGPMTVAMLLDATVVAAERASST